MVRSGQQQRVDRPEEEERRILAGAALSGELKQGGGGSDGGGLGGGGGGSGGLIGLDAPWFDRGTLGGLGTISEWNLPIFALTAHTPQIVEGPVTLLPADTPVAEIVGRVEAAVHHPSPSFPGSV